MCAATCFLREDWSVVETVRSFPAPLPVLLSWHSFTALRDPVHEILCAVGCSVIHSLKNEAPHYKAGCLHCEKYTAIISVVTESMFEATKLSWRVLVGSSDL